MAATRRKLFIYALLIGAFFVGHKVFYLRNERNVLDHSDNSILYSLSGRSVNDGPTVTKFHRYQVLGQTQVTDLEERARLINTLYAGIPTGSSEESACFSPRHGIRATWNGCTVDAEICFECGRIYFYTNGKPSSDWPVNSTPREVFDEALIAAHLPLAKR